MSQSKVARKSDRSSVWRLAQLLGRVELARGLPRQRLAAELALLKQEMGIHSRALGTDRAAFVALLEDHWMDVARGVRSKKA